MRFCFIRNRILSALLAVCLMLPLSPVTASAEGMPLGNAAPLAAGTVSVTTEAELRDTVANAVYKDYTINIDDNINLISPLTIGQNIALTSDNGSTLTAGANNIAIINDAEVTFNGDLRITGSGNSVVQVEEGEFTLEGTASLAGTGASAKTVYVPAGKGGQINIKGGTITGARGIGIDGKSASVTVSGGQINGTENAIRLGGTDCQASISGGTMSGTYAVHIGSKDWINISGGDITGSAHALYALSKDTYLTGGNFFGKVSAGANGAAINITAGNVTFSGSTPGVYYYDTIGYYRAFLTALPGVPLAAIQGQQSTVSLTGAYNGVTFAVDAATSAELEAISSGLGGTAAVSMMPTAAGNYSLVLNSEVGGQKFKLTLPVTVESAAPPSGVCAIGTTVYPTLDAALAAVEDATPTTIRLLQDITVTRDAVGTAIPVLGIANKQISFDLNNHTLTIMNSSNAWVQQALKVQNSTITFSGPGICNVENYREYGLYVDNSTITLDGAAELHVNGNVNGVQAWSNSNVTVTSTQQSADYGSAADARTKSRITVKTDAAAKNYAVYATDEDSIVQVDGNATSNNSTGVYVCDLGAAWVKGNVSGTTGCEISGGGNITIEGSLNGIDKYIRISGHDYTSGDITTPTGKQGYLTYGSGNGTSTVWVKDNTVPAGTTGNPAWEKKASLPSSSPIEDMKYLNSTFWAVGYNSTLLKSADGETWTKVDVGSEFDRLKGVAYGNGTYVLVGTSGDYSSRIYTSGDGDAWTEKAAAPQQLNDVAFGSGKFVAVGGDSNVLISTDNGETWQSRKLNQERGKITNLLSITYTGTKFVAVGGRSDTGQQYKGSILTSADGETWTWAHGDVNNTIWDITYGNGTLVAVGGKDSGPSLICTSSNAEIWTVLNTSIKTYSSLFSVEFDGTRFIAAGRTNSGNNAFITISTDGATWTENTDGGKDGFNAAASNGTKLVAMDGYGSIYSSAVTGIGWEYRNNGSTWTLNDVAYNNSLFVAVGVKGVIQTSTNGTNWTLQISKTTKDLNRVEYLGGQFIAVGKNGTILTSVNGKDWTVRTSGTTNELKGIAYGGGQYVVIGGDSSLGSVVLVSADGASWISAASGSLVRFDAVAYGDGTFIALTKNGAAYRSTDGTNWTQATDLHRFAKYPTDMIYAAGKFVAVGGSGEVYLSSDKGDSWTIAEIAFDRYNRGIAYSNGNFIAVGELGNIIASADGGITWYSQPSGLELNSQSSDNDMYTNLNGVTAGPDCFLAVGERGLVLQSDMSAVSSDTDAHDVAVAKAALWANSIKHNADNSLGSITMNMHLMTELSALSEVNISWQSSKPQYIASNGTVTRPALADGDQVVYLTATFTKNAAVDRKTFIVCVLAYENQDIEDVQNALNALTFDKIKNANTAFDNIISDLDLSYAPGNGVSISWASDSNLISTDGRVLRPGQSMGDVTVMLTATLTKGSVTRTKNFNLTVKAIPASHVPVTAITNGPSSATAGAPLTLMATVVPANATIQVITWSVRDAGGTGAAIDGDTLRTTAAGTAVIRATVAGGGSHGADYAADFPVTVSAPTYSITINNGASNMSTAAAGTVVTITANTPESGKRFEGWIYSPGISFVNGTGVKDTTAQFTMPAQAVTLTATYEPLPPAIYSITVQNDGNGIARAMVNSGNVSSAAPGTEITLAATANSGYKFKTWEVIGGSVSITENKFTMPTENVTIKAVFEPIPPASYKVVVNGSYAATSGAGSYVQGASVTIHAGSRSGYSFTGWISPDGVAFANASSATTTFAMPAKNVTVTANWGYNGGGGNSSGGSGSGSGYTPPAGWNITTDKKPNQPTIASMDINAAIGTNGNAAIAITDAMTKALIEKAQAKAKAGGETADGIGVALNILFGKSSGSITITVEAAAIDRLEREGAKLFGMNNPLVSFTLDAEAIKEVNKRSAGNVSFNASPITKLSDAAKGLIGSRPVFDVTVSYQKDGKRAYVSDLKKGMITLGIAYTLTSMEKSGNLYGVHVDKNGKQTLLTNSGYDNKRLIFSCNKMAAYGVGYKTPPPVFTDTAKHWAKDDIDFAAGRGLISGTSATTFSPNMDITRQDFLMALGKLSGADISGYKESSFSDVSGANPAMPYIQWAVKNGIVQGTGGGRFGPDSVINREQMAVMMVNYAEYAGYKLPVSLQAVTFADDAKISSWAKEAVKAIQQSGVIIGKNNNRFDPAGNATRGEASTILRRFVELVIGEGMVRS